MQPYRRFFPALLVSLWLMATLSSGLAQSQTSLPASVRSPTTCTEGAQASGATYRICMPVTWNNRLLIYAHGYVAPNRPVGIPEDQMTLPGTNTRLDEFVNAQGYAFATSGYSTNGLAIVQGLADVVELVSILSRSERSDGWAWSSRCGEGKVVLTSLLPLSRPRRWRK